MEMSAPSQGFNRFDQFTARLEEALRRPARWCSTSSGTHVLKQAEVDRWNIVTRLRGR
jgi:hypothetical protein